MFLENFRSFVSGMEQGAHRGILPGHPVCDELVRGFRQKKPVLLQLGTRGPDGLAPEQFQALCPIRPLKVLWSLQWPRPAHMVAWTKHADSE